MCQLNCEPPEPHVQGLTAIHQLHHLKNFIWDYRDGFGLVGEFETSLYLKIRVGGTQGTAAWSVCCQAPQAPTCSCIYAHICEHVSAHMYTHTNMFLHTCTHTIIIMIILILYSKTLASTAVGRGPARACPLLKGSHVVGYRPLP